MKIQSIFLFFLLFSISVTAQTMPNTKEEVITIIKKANDYWQANNSTNVRAFWDNAAYHTGNMEAYAITGLEKYRTYSETWATYNNWMGATGTNKANWKFTYGESADYVLFGDWQICFQTYADLYNLSPDPAKIARAREVMEYQMSTTRNNYWWWADGLYMVMPVMTKLYKITGNSLYLDKLYTYFNFADKLMYDQTESLYYRDSTYVYPKSKTNTGLKNFWARGDGWVFAGLAKVLKDLPQTDTHHSFYESRFKSMANALINCQQEQGYWTRSLLDSAYAPGYETSGTAFFTYGLLWGINNGYLDKSTYLPAALKGWSYLSSIALQSNGSVGYVQPIGSQAIPGTYVYATNTANFGVGAFLLAACELTRTIDATTGVQNTTQGKSLSAYPLPATDEITVTDNEPITGNVKLFDSTGKLVKEQPANSNITTINISDLTPGIYFLRANNQAIKVVRK